MPALLPEQLPVPPLLPTVTPMATPSLPPVSLPGEGKLPMPKLAEDPILPKPMLEPKLIPVPVEVLPPVDFKPPTEVLPIPAPAPPAALPMGDPKGSIDLKTFKPLDPEPIPMLKLTPPAIDVPTPVAVEAKTDYDVDIHKLRAGDTYAAISEKFYGVATFANALRGYNDNADLTRLRDVQVPPMHIIKKFGGAGVVVNTPKVIPAGIIQDPTPSLVTPPKIEGAVEWGSPGARKPTTPLKPGDETVNWK